ncbi:MAG: amylo-alpha-1,6-glucosidase [Phycisphaerae bacterium]
MTTALPHSVRGPAARDLLRLRSLEWLATNGRGGFAMGTPANLLTRRYHGLLIAAIHPPADRWLLLAKLEPTLIVHGERVDLATNDYVGAVHPHGYQALDSFAPAPLPAWRFAGPAGALVEQELWMAPGRDATFVRFRLLAGPPEVGLELRPLCTSRSMHALAERGQLGEPRIDARPHGFSVQFNNRPALHVDARGEFRALPDWYYQFVLAAEADRGQADRQDLFMPGPLTGSLRLGDDAGLIVAAGSEPVSAAEWRTTRDAALAGASAAPLPEAVRDPLATALARATAPFIVARGTGQSVIAGYPWFADWGRDTFIALPGLCLVTQRFDVARNIIDAFVGAIDRGMVPNRFPDVGERPDYNTVDAALWFVHAIDRYLAYSRHWSFVAERAWPALCAVLDAYQAGTRHQIRCDRDGLLAAGEPGAQLTWMDAKVGDQVITPRIGKPVEVQALWYNALRIGAQLAERIGDASRAERWSDAAYAAAHSFNARYWNGDAGCCLDVVDANHVPGSVDPAIRPNQLLAISLTYPVLEPHRWAGVVEVCRQKLLTPIGLRTLDPDHADFRAHYRGDLPNRDRAYHQGTIWPWLLGPFISAAVRAAGNTPAARRAARGWLAGLEAHLDAAGLGSVSEVAEAEPPHRPDGCPFQAWSVAEPLRALVEDVLDAGPK